VTGNREKKPLVRVTATRTARERGTLSLAKRIAPLEDRDHIPLETYVQVRLVQLGETLARAATATFETQFHLRNAELWILAQLGGNGPLAISEISRRTRIDKAWISRSSGALSRRGLVRRWRHPSDSRVTLLSLTPKGSELLSKIAPVSRRRHDWLLRGLPKRQVYEVLDALQLRAEALLRDPDL
jgi:DNA-binding MarR family transcriptional regulator